MNDDFGVAGGLENGAAMLEFAAPLRGIGQISVVSDGDFAFAAINDDGLRVGERGVTGGGIARVSDGGIARKCCKAFGIENILDESHPFSDAKIGSVGGTNSGGFLSTMLQSVEP